MKSEEEYLEQDEKTSNDTGNPENVKRTRKRKGIPIDEFMKDFVITHKDLLDKLKDS